jgi:acetolactate synthase-1/2/3 large subunit
MTNYVDGGEAVLEAFRSLGIDYVMASPGSEWGAVWEALARQKVRNSPGPTYLSCAHETLAVDLAIGYTAITGRMQAVMLHTGVGLLQGSMGIDGAQRFGTPMLVVSGEALTYGERQGFDPGAQWHANLSVVGGPHRLVEPLVKWANQASSTETLYQQLVSAGEMAQRAPTGPTYLAVPIETMLNEWTPPANVRDAPPPSKPHAPLADIERLAGMLADARNPVIITESIGREPEGYAALVALAELLALPVIEGNQSVFANFPRDHELHQGIGRREVLDEADLVITIRCRAPWYPPSDRPAAATVVAIDETPFRPHMVHHASHADMFLEGDAVATLELLAEALRVSGGAGGKIDERRARWAAAHDRLAEADRATVAEVAGNRPIHPITMAAALGEALPDDTVFVDETISHRGVLLRHLGKRQPRSYLRPAGGLGQGIGVALGMKLAAPDRLVAAVIGDGSFMYNPVTQALALSKHEGLAILIVVANNTGYLAMKREHRNFYPDGVSVENDIFYGHPITDLAYEELVQPFGGFGRRVEEPADLAAAFGEAQEAVAGGRTAIVNVMVDS